MPELPEVETIVRQLRPGLPGRRIRQTAVHHPDVLEVSPPTFQGQLQGAEILAVDRRGKNIVLSLSANRFLVVNLGMTGRLHLLDPEAPTDLPSHPAVTLSLQPEGTLFYADVRRFGLLRVLSAVEWKRESARLGPEPLEPALTAEDLHIALMRSRSPIRSWLLDQEKVAGVGNIYAAEALYRAGIHPRRAANSIAQGEAGRLLKGIRAVLREAIEARGTTLRDYRTASGEPGNFGPALRVYGRAGEPCPRCKVPVERIVFGNRSAFFCPHCQPESF